MCEKTLESTAFRWNNMVLKGKGRKINPTFVSAEGNLLFFFSFPKRIPLLDARASSESD